MKRFLLTAAMVAVLFRPGGLVAYYSEPVLTLTQKALRSDAVIVATVVEFEKEELEVRPHPGAKETVKLRVATLKVETGLIGAKNITHFKVLLRPLVEGTPAVGDAALYFLTRHPTANGHFHFNADRPPIRAKDNGYEAVLAKVRAIAGTLSDPLKALTTGKSEDRYDAAAILIQKHCNALAVPSKQEAIPAEEAKAILKALRDADWIEVEKPPRTGGLDLPSHPLNLLKLLGLHPGVNGFPAVKPGPGENAIVKHHEAFKAWLEKSGDKFEIKKFVPKD